MSMSTWLRIWVEPCAARPIAWRIDWRCGSMPMAIRFSRSMSIVSSSTARGCSRARACPRSSCRDGCAPRRGREWRSRRGHPRQACRDPARSRPIAAIRPSRIRMSLFAPAIGPDVAEQEIGHSSFTSAFGLSASRSQSPSRLTDDDEQAELDDREEDDPPRAGEQELVADADQRAERRLGRRHADAEE